MALEAGVPSIHSVDSDKGLLEALLRKSEKSASKLHAYHGDLGMSGDWGFPLNNESSEKWPLYSAGVWATLLRENARPDLILIDGRFRVACFLASCWFAKEGTVILFDDYQDRPHYHVVERHIKPSLQVGRMALFKKEGVLSEALLADMMLSVTDVR